MKKLWLQALWAFGLSILLSGSGIAAQKTGSLGQGLINPGFHEKPDWFKHSFLDLQEDWCELRDCESSQDLLDEDRAIYEALTNYQVLGFRGGAILIDSNVEAFALGEKLNENTAVIHIEKANPEIPGLYAAINQRFCAQEWAEVRYVNREQDLGIEGLRKAKLSYHPDHLVEKYTVIPRWSDGAKS